jgi:hypothetical protein
MTVKVEKSREPSTICFLLFVFILVLFGICSKFQLLWPDYSYNEEQTSAVEGLISRLFPQRSSEFKVLIDSLFNDNGKDVFSVSLI